MKAAAFHSQSSMWTKEPDRMGDSMEDCHSYREVGACLASERQRMSCGLDVESKPAVT